MAKITGPYARETIAEKGNGEQPPRICQKQQMVSMTTWRQPRIAQQGRWKTHQQKADMAKERRKRELRDNIPQHGQSQTEHRAGKLTTS